MIYVISGNIIFDTDELSLTLDEVNETIKLATPTGRLLHAILNYGAGIISRDYLLEEVWEKNGLRGSNNNLNQYLSILRKILADLGCDQAIITMPRQGFVLNEDLTFYVQIPSREEKAVTEEAETEDALALPEDKPFSPPGKNQFIILSLLAFLMITACGYLFYFPQSDENITVFPFKSSEGCDVNLLRSVSKHDLPQVQEQLSVMLSNNRLICNEKTRVYFDYHTSLSTRDLGRTLLSFCRLDEKNHPTSCDNFYYDNWIIK